MGAKETEEIPRNSNGEKAGRERDDHEEEQRNPRESTEARENQARTQRTRFKPKKSREIPLRRRRGIRRNPAEVHWQKTTRERDEDGEEQRNPRTSTEEKKTDQK